MFSADAPVPVVKKNALPVMDTVENFELITAEYPDPFGNDISEDVQEDKTDSVAKMTVAVTPPVVVEPPPVITYNGYIYNPVTKKKTAIISINGHAVTAGINEKVDVKTLVVDITETKLVVSFNGTKMEVVLSGS